MNNKLKSAIKDFKNGKFLIVVDHKKRENEADIVLAAEKVTPQKINFMITHAKGLVCVPMAGKLIDKLNLPAMTKVNTELHHCKFTVSVDYKKGTSTGISAFDRSATIKALSNPRSKPSDFAKPGHIFPLRCDDGGLRKRQGHTEAAIELCSLAKMKPIAVICEIIGKNGRMARENELKRFSKKFKIRMLD